MTEANPYHTEEPPKQEKQTQAREASWYIVQRSAGHCDLVDSTELDQAQATQTWGPYASQGEAIAKRVGLIRSGKCQPV